MNKATILALAAIVLALIGYILTFERSSVTSKERQGRVGRVLVSFVRDKVERLVVERNGVQVVLLRKTLSDGTPGGFEVRAPFVAKADQDVVDHLLGELEWLSARRTLEAISPADAAQFGLTTPRYRVTFEAGGERHVLAIGSADVHGESVYARVDDAVRAYVVPKTLLETLDHEPGDYRDKQLFGDLTVAWAQKFQLRRATGQRAFVKQRGRWWTAETPQLYADGKRLEQLLHALAELRATHYPDTAARPKAEAALRSATLRIEVAVVPEETREDQKARAYVLELAGPCDGHPDERYVRSSLVGSTDVVYACIATSALQPFEGGDDAFREARLFTSELSSITRIVLARGADKLTLSRNGTQWAAPRVAPTDQPVAYESDAVDAWLADLAAARATKFALAEGFSEQGSLTLELAQGKSERIAVGELNTADDSVLVKRGDEPMLVSFPASVFDRLLPSAGRFRSLAVWSSHQPSEVVRIDVRVRVNAEDVARQLTLGEGSWKSVTPGVNVDSERVRELVRELLHVRALAYLSEQPRAGHGLTRLGARLELGLSKGGSLTLQLGAPTDRGCYARVDGGAVVELGGVVIAMLNELAGGARVAPAAPQPGADDDNEAESSLDEGHAH